jgi:hypothetical protein
VLALDTIATEAKMIGERRNRERGAMCLAKMNPISFLEALNDFFRNFYGGPLGTRFGVDVWVQRNFQTNYSFPSLSITDSLEFPK